MTDAAPMPDMASGSPKRRRPRVAVIGTGGSIAVEGLDSLDIFEYGDHGRVISVEELIAMVPEVAAVADVVPLAHRAVISTAFGPKEWLQLSRAVEGAVAADSHLDGIVITHGTAVIEETAYFLNLVLKCEVPIVLVGSVRPPTGLSSDAHLNLVNAIRVAATPVVRGLGVLVVLNGAIHAARDVTKGATLSVDAFRSPDVGILGFADPDGEVRVYRTPTRRHGPGTEFDVALLDDLPRVDIAYSYGGSDGSWIGAAVRLGAVGVISAGFAPGLVTPAEMEALLAARAAGIVVVQSSRAGSGRVGKRTRTRAAGFVAADNLNPQKARILAMLALTVTRDPVEVQRIFDEY